jgi:hypothetical protein
MLIYFSYFTAGDGGYFNNDLLNATICGGGLATVYVADSSSKVVVDSISTVSLENGLSCYSNNYSTQNQYDT